MEIWLRRRDWWEPSSEELESKEVENWVSIPILMTKEAFGAEDKWQTQITGASAGLLCTYKVSIYT